MIIAIDGPAASGKGTLASRVARHYGLGHMDTGALYRAVARDVLASGGDLHDASTGETAARDLDPMTLEDPLLRTHRMGEAASIVASHSAVRDMLLAVQRTFARSRTGAVLDGRDIGTVICPDADVKIFVVASPQERARRRHRDLLDTGIEVTPEEVLADIRKRDERDRGRDAAPLVQAPDAHLLDTTELDIEAAVKAAIDIVDAAIRR